ncbi:hypothetical protein Amir_5580 [Actinosynnema mirum DSM 43827]|uniref:Uncharacterized protein n=1 Tax=Actinosynnema mirum (strain ATCC 29888 / DSM 43827 / JCM 3225 / NBRC 14064 / NCIMB 13271 / NRRL B-12336 / IMRU 3971 / 101) TaxID=446462 RepID=C6WBA7_ACTMD|nr:hypothetical protein Amir_5580 [Actinosynnema mirum DSM 43827]
MTAPEPDPGEIAEARQIAEERALLGEIIDET